MKALIVGLLAVSTAILPPMDRRHPRTARVSRGMNQIRVGPELFQPALDAAHKATEAGQRWAALPWAVRGDSLDAVDAIGWAMAFEHDLHYVPGAIVVDPGAVLAAVGSENLGTELDARNLGERLEATRVITGSVAETEDGLAVTAELWIQSDGSWNRAAVYEDNAPATDFHALADRVLVRLLEAAEMSVDGERRAQIEVIPTTSDAARRACDQSMLLLYEAAAILQSDAAEGEPSADRAKQLNDEAYELALEALRSDRDYLRGYLVMASVLSNQEKPSDMTRVLSVAARALVNREADRLTALELQGDIYHFASDPEKLPQATECYRDMLQINEFHLRAHWSLIDSVLGAQDDLDQVPAADQETAARHAALILAAHPQSAMARALSP